MCNNTLVIYLGTYILEQWRGGCLNIGLHKKRALICKGISSSWTIYHFTTFPTSGTGLANLHPHGTGDRRIPLDGADSVPERRLVG